MDNKDIQMFQVYNSCKQDELKEWKIREKSAIILEDEGMYSNRKTIGWQD